VVSVIRSIVLARHVASALFRFLALFWTFALWTAFGLYGQPDLDQPADGFGAVGAVILAPHVNQLGQSGRETYGADGIDATLFLRAAAGFLVYRN